MCQGVIEVRALEARFGIDFNGYFAESLARLQAHAADGLIVMTDDRIRVTNTGRLLLRSIAMCFDAYQNAAVATPAARPSFSRVV
jgi:oxygen-independent coproporphyrinogen-3 oxidase